MSGTDGMGALCAATLLATLAANRPVTTKDFATEDELAVVNLDEEAGKLMEQQQAYKAAAQILQTARDLFDTIISIM